MIIKIQEIRISSKSVAGDGIRSLGHFRGLIGLLLFGTEFYMEGEGFLGNFRPS